MMQFQSFDSIEEMQAALREAEDAANARINPVQRWLRDAHDETHYFVRPYEGFLIFGEAYSIEEFVALERKHGADEDELEHSREAVIDRRKRGFMFCRCYSIIEERGELGDTHVSEVMPIPSALFEYARNHGWVLEPARADGRCCDDPECGGNDAKPGDTPT